MNEGGEVDGDDVDWLVEALLGTRRGDANLDRKLNFADFLILADQFGAAASSWSLGDFDGDGTVAFTDFLVLANEFGFEASP